MAKIKKQDHEKLTNSNIEHVIKLLEAQQPITKKAACEILNISYNTTRLANIIEQYKSEKAYEAERRDKNRGKPLEKHEIQTIIELYLAGEGVTEIAKRLFRGATLVNATLERIGVPKRPVGDLKFEKSILPEQCIAHEFAKGDLAWSAKYHGPCRIEEELTPEFVNKNAGLAGNYDYPCYRIYVTERLEEVPLRFSAIKVGGHYAYAFAYDLGSLDHLKEYINVDKLGT